MSLSAGCIHPKTQIPMYENRISGKTFDKEPLPVRGERIEEGCRK
jgi:hypothetical protein